MTTLVDDIRAAKHELITRGRCRKNLMDEENRVCLMGAIGLATIENFAELAQSNPALAMFEVEWNPRSSAVSEELKKYLDMKSPTVSPIWLFNDNERNTDDDVFNLLDKALADLGGLL